MCRDSDGAAARFGDLWVRTTTDIAASSIYASRDPADPARLVLVAINETGAPSPRASP